MGFILWRFQDVASCRPKTADAFNAIADGVPLGIVQLQMGSKILLMGLPGREKSLMISLAVYPGVTDRQTDVGRRLVPRHA